jgi:hypothetical protein
MATRTITRRQGSALLTLSDRSSLSHISLVPVTLRYLHSRMDRGYTILLSHLHRLTNSSDLKAIQSSISHHLAHVSISPTPLAASVIASVLFTPYSHYKLQVLTTAFRHAVHFKYQLLKVNQGGLFQKGMTPALGDWVLAVVAGYKGGPPISRLAAAGGLLLGLEDVAGKMRLGNLRWRRRVQDEVVLAVAETMDVCGQKREDGWEKEFLPPVEAGER